MPKKKQPVDKAEILQKSERDTYLFYKGRHPAFPKSHFYIVEDTNKEVTFGKRLQPSHKIGVGYPAHVSKEGRSYGTSRYVEIGNMKAWPDKREVAQWIREDESAGREKKRIDEEAGLRTLARKLAAEIAPQYKRASSLTKRDIIAAFIETLEG